MGAKFRKGRPPYGDLCGYALARGARGLQVQQVCIYVYRTVNTKRKVIFYEENYNYRAQEVRKIFQDRQYKA